MPYLAHFQVRRARPVQREHEERVPLDRHARRRRQSHALKRSGVWALWRVLAARRPRWEARGRAAVAARKAVVPTGAAWRSRWRSQRTMACRTTIRRPRPPARIGHWPGTACPALVPGPDRGEYL